MFRQTLSFVLFSGALLASAQVGDRAVVLEEVIVPGLPGVQSFAWGQHNGEWLLVGGRTDGLHQRQPFAAFLASGNNTTFHVVDPSIPQVWSSTPTGLSAALAEQLQSTNMQFQQRGDVLYVIGGYGYSATAADHITHPQLTAIDVPGCIGAIKNNQPIAPFVRQLSDPRMELTGGQLGLEGDHFYLVGGQRFIGRYNPMGPNFGPGFVQEYSNGIRRFRIDDDGTTMTIADYSNTIDTVNLHRRDYNMLPQFFPDGSTGFTAFSGVFQYGQNIPWLNTVDIVDTGYTVVPVFEQLLNQYHGAHMAAWDSASNTMYSTFFGGIARYYFDSNGLLWDDPNVPFVNTISLVERDANWNMLETAIGEMPALLGAGAEFIPLNSAPYYPNGIVRLNQLSGDTVLVGHVVGGIESSQANIFFINTGTQSTASTRMFRVYLVRNGNTGIEDPTERDDMLTVLSPLGTDQWTITVDLVEGGMTELVILDSTGRTVRTVAQGRLPKGQQVFHVSVADLPAGSYFVEFRSNGTQRTVHCIH